MHTRVHLLALLLPALSACAPASVDSKAVTTRKAAAPHLLAHAPLELDLTMAESPSHVVFDGLESSEETIAVFVLSRGGEVDLAMTGDEFGEVWAEPYAEFTDDEGVHTQVSRLDIELATASMVEVMWELDEDAIEARLWMCDQVVDTRLDSGPGSLREGVAQVRDGGMVCFDPAVFLDPSGGKVQLQEEIATQKDLTIRGVAGASIVSAGGSGRAFRFEGDTTVRRLTVEHGEADDGGLIHASGPLRMQEVTLRDGVASGRGGALAHFGPDAVSLEHVAFELSTAETLGGGAYLEGPTAADDVRAAANTAWVAGGGVYADTLDSDGLRLSGNSALDGGGMWIGTGTLRGLDVSNNHADRGGGLAVGSSVNAREPRIYNNVAESTVDVARGGGVYVASGARLILGGSAPASSGLPATVGHNRATEGGGVAIASGGSLQLLGDARIDSNVASRGGGVSATSARLWIFDDAEVVDNAAVGTHGGGLLLRDSRAHLAYRARVVENSARRNGGGIYMDPSSPPSTLVLDDIPGYSGARIEDNDASFGGGVYQWGSLVGATIGVHITGNTPQDIVQH